MYICWQRWSQRRRDCNSGFGHWCRTTWLQLWTIGARALRYTGLRSQVGRIPFSAPLVLSWNAWVAALVAASQVLQNYGAEAASRCPRSCDWFHASISFGGSLAQGAYRFSAIAEATASNTWQIAWPRSRDLRETSEDYGRRRGMVLHAPPCALDVGRVE